MSSSGQQYQTQAGNYYAGHSPCRGGWNLPECGTWNEARFTRSSAPTKGWVLCATVKPGDRLSVTDDCLGKGDVRWKVEDETGNSCQVTDFDRVGWEYPNNNAQSRWE